MSFTAAATRVGDSLKYEVDVNHRHTIVTDEPRPLGGSDEGPAPHELLPAAIAACIATTMAMYAERKGWDIGEASVEVAYDAEVTPRGVAVTLHLPDDLSSDQLRRLERIAESCPLRRSLEAGFVFEERIETVPRPARS